VSSIKCDHAASSAGQPLSASSVMSIIGKLLVD
jgi:hypothetical protein